MRNPMYAAVVAVILGQALMFCNSMLAAYGLTIWICFHVFVLVYEEPKLRSTYGDSYLEYCRRVPRWIPAIPARKFG